MKPRGANLQRTSKSFVHISDLLPPSLSYLFFFSLFRSLDIELEDDEDEDKIIEQRRKQREELLKVVAEIY